MSGALSDPVWSSRGELAFLRRGWIWVGSPPSLHRLARGSDPAWSPDGSGIVFDRNGWLLVRRLGARRARRLVRGSAPVWSPDGRWIAFIGNGHHLSVVRVRGGRARRVGRVTGRTVDWQPLPLTPPTACLTPSGSTVLASSDAATVSADDGVGLSVPYSTNWAVMGCLRADGRERLLTSRVYSYGSRCAQLSSSAVLAGTFAALEVQDQCSGSSYPVSISVYDLRSGQGSEDYDQTWQYSAPTIDPLLLNASGFTAWLLTGSDKSEQLYAHDNQGTNIVDSTPPGSGTVIGNVQLTGDQLTWTHDGTPHELTLQ